MQWMCCQGVDRYLAKFAITNIQSVFCPTEAEGRIANENLLKIKNISVYVNPPSGSYDMNYIAT